MRARDLDRLLGARHQMHFHATLLGLPDGTVQKSIEIDRRAQLAIHSQQQIAVDRRGDTKRVVVGDEQPLRGLDEIDTEQYGITVFHAGADVLQKCGRAWRIEVPDVGPEKGHERPACPLAQRLAQPGIIGRLVRDQAYVTDASDRLRSDREGTWRYVDQMYVDRPAAPRCRLEERPQLLAISGTQLDDVRQ